MTPEEAIISLRACPLFRDFPDGAVASLAPYFQVVTGEKGARLFDEGNPSDGLFVIVHGSLAVAIRDALGVDKVVNELSAPEAFGELSLLLRSERMIAVEALEDVVLLELDGESFRALKSQNPDLCLLLIMVLVRRFGRVLDDARTVLRELMLKQLESVDVS